jgi:4,5-DOPA dioxygenase extradiol
MLTSAAPTDLLAPLPALFVSHGSPMYAMKPGCTGAALADWGRALRAQWPQINAVLVMSPHWMAPMVQVMTTPQPATWHDFAGFPTPLYQLRYPAPGAPTLGQEVVRLLHASGIQAQTDDQRPFDHGAWVPLMHLFAQADVPVVQIALPEQATPQDVLAMGSALQSLRRLGVLLVGSGSMTHNLREFFGGPSTPTPYVDDFCRWVEAALQQGDVNALLNYRQLAPQAERAHPSDEHFLPLFFALGAAGQGARPHYISREVVRGVLAMDTFALH